jgi:hypothetical protein
MRNFTFKALLCQMSNQNRQTKLDKIKIHDEDSLILVSRSVFIDSHGSRREFKSRFTTQNVVISRFTIGPIVGHSRITKIPFTPLKLTFLI